MMTTFLTILTIVLIIVFAAAGEFFCRGRAAMGARLMWACWAGGLALLVCNAILAQAPPFGNMRHVLCFFPLALVPAWLYLRRMRGVELGSFFAWAGGLALIGTLCMPMQAGWRQMPALQSPWFVPHVTSYVFSYALLTVSAILALLSLWGEEQKRLQQADEVVRLAFPFLVFGLCSGALWADAAWGRYWAWDIKEVWSLITCVVYLLYFHAAQSLPTWRRPLLLLGFAAVIVTFLVVNLLPKISSLHSYAL